MNEKLKKKAEQFERAYEMQKKARERAEYLLEEKSRELYLNNQSLKEALDKVLEQQQQIVLQEKLAALGQVGAGMAHELNNPNAFIQNNIETLNEYVSNLLQAFKGSIDLNKELAEKSPKDFNQQEIQQRINTLIEQSECGFIEQDLDSIIEESLKGTQRINEIATGLRSFVEPDLSNLQPTDLNQCIRDALHLVKGHSTDIQIQLNLDNIEEIDAVAVLLSQAIANLIQNACESNPKSGVVSVKSYSKERSIEIEISDDGIGMSQEELNRIFNPFYTSSNTRQGLGLSIAQSIINQHKGQIFIKSTPDVGTLVTVKIPTNLVPEA